MSAAPAGEVDTPPVGSYCIATYKRPEMLSELLDSLVAQQLPDALTMECIVVDNDPAGSARAVCERFGDALRLDYSIQPKKNISLTRNQAVQRARGSWLFFIDDDEVACPIWARSLWETAQQTGADGVTGHLKPAFSESAPDWLTRTRFFHRDVPPTGTRFLFTGIGNCVIRRSALELLVQDRAGRSQSAQNTSEREQPPQIDASAPFSEHYGLTGGEDTWLLRNLHRAGAKLVACREAVVTEHIPAARSSPSFLLDRARRTGALYTYMALRLRSSPRWLTGAWLGAKAAGLWSLFALRGIWARVRAPGDQALRLRWALRRAAYRGHLDGLFGRITQGY